MIKPLPKVVVVDANFLVAMVSPKTSADDRARINHFLSEMERSKSKIIIPMPAVAEYLVRIHIAGIETLDKLERKTFIDIAPFDRAAAFECAQMDRAALNASGDKKDEVDAHWQKIKIDRQIVAIGKAKGAALVISADGGVRNNALRVGMKALRIEDLELPDEAKQHKLPLVPLRKGGKRLQIVGKSTGPNAGKA